MLLQNSYEVLPIYICGAAGVRSQVLDYIWTNVLFFTGEALTDSPIVEHFTSEPLLSYYVSWILIGQCGITGSLLLLPTLCPAKNNDVTLVAMVHSGASRNMPEIERKGRCCCCVWEAMLKLNVHIGRVEEQRTHFITVQSLSVCVCLCVCYCYDFLDDLIVALWQLRRFRKYLLRLFK